MSLLMQALKKAERAKQNSLADDGLDHGLPDAAPDGEPSMAPLEPAAPAARPGAGLSLDLDALELTPMSGPDRERAGAPEPAPAHTPDFGLEGVEPPAVIATEATHDPVPPQAKHVKSAEAPRAARRPTASAGTAAPPEPQSAAARARAAAAASAGAGGGGGGLDPAKLRVIGLSGVAVAIALVFAYFYWQATNAPGAGAHLPMVPMPPANASGATAATVVVTRQNGAAPLAVMPDDEPAPNDAKVQELQQQLEQRDRELALRQQLAQAQAQAAAQASPPPESLPPAAAPDNGDIHIARGNDGPQLNPGLQDGYRDYNSGDLAGAQQQYDAVLRQEPTNRDALLGSAAVAVKGGQRALAANAYRRLLELAPDDPDALAGMVALGQADPERSESRLKGVLRAAPDAAPAQFALGNLYARQGRWAEAQQAYFSAYTAEPTNADYAFNLAVGLDRLNQGKLALGYYQRALALAQDSASAFDRAALRKRLQQLGHSAP